MVVGCGALLGLFSLLLALMKDMKVTLLHQKCVIGIPADELLNVQSVDERYPSLLHSAAHEIDLGAKAL